MRGCALAVVVLASAASRAVAQPGDDVELGEGWTRQAGETEEAMVRADGMRIELAPASLPCAKQLRLSEIPRPAWLSTIYWPVIDAAGNALLLCVEGKGGPVAVTVKPPVGASAGPELAPALTRLAELLSPPATTDGFGTLASSLPIVEVRGSELLVKVDDDVVRVVAVHADASCATADASLHRCIDTGRGHVAITVDVATPEGVLDDLIDTIGRAAIARYGVPAPAAPAAAAVTVGVAPLDAVSGPRERSALAIAAAYLSWVSIGSASGGRHNGGVVGFNGRVANLRDLGLAFAFQGELGFGSSGLLGEVRTGVGFNRGRRVVVEGLVGGGVSSLGPAAALDLHAELGAALPFGRGVVWLGGLRTLGIDGPDHTQVELRMTLPRSDALTGGYYLASRYVDFAGDDGDAFILSFGAGITARD